MDLATLIGVVGGFGIVVMAIMMGGEFGLFVNAPSLLVVGGGTIAVVFMRFPMAEVFNAFKVAANAFFNRTASPEQLISTAVEMAGMVRKEGLLSLEEQEVPDSFFQKGLTLCVDGHPPEFVRKLLTQDMTHNLSRHETGQKVWLSIGDAAPAMGMIGTLIGLVQMLANMDDPESIGPAMAVALLTTLYGALIANLVAIPIAEKLELRSGQEKLNKTLIIETVAAIQEGVNPRVMDESLQTFLPTSKRVPADEGAAA
ncbi:MAG: flagellar motor protein PomA [Immundisolibacteraceae bacterium]|nr:flagellar motor protein PomA [Immundisolibacteraceae bacterium]